MLPDGNRPSTGYARFDAGTVNMRIATSLIGDRAGQAQPRARAHRRRHGRERPRPRAAQVGRQARHRRGRGRHRRPAHHALLEPLPAVPVSELGAREHRLGVATPRGSTRCSRRTDTPAEQRDEDGRARRRRQGLRQQRLLGHLPDHVVGVLAVHAPRRRRDGRRLRPAVPRRRLDRALVVTGLREPDDRHELGRRLRRRIRQGRAGPQGPRHLRRRGQERDGRAAGRPVEPEHRPQGPDRGAVPRLHAVARVRGRLVGARGRHQRLRHRQHGGEAGGRDATARPRASGCGRSGSTSAAARRTT